MVRQIWKMSRKQSSLKTFGTSKRGVVTDLSIFVNEAAQTEPLQANHQFTPDAVGHLMIFIIEQLFPAENVSYWNWDLGWEFWELVS